MKSLCFRIPADLYEDLMRGDSPEIDEALARLEGLVRISVEEILLEEQIRCGNLLAEGCLTA